MFIFYSHNSTIALKKDLNTLCYYLAHVDLPLFLMIDILYGTYSTFCTYSDWTEENTYVCTGRIFSRAERTSLQGRHHGNASGSSVLVDPDPVLRSDPFYSVGSGFLVGSGILVIVHL